MVFLFHFSFLIAHYQHIKIQLISVYFIYCDLTESIYQFKQFSLVSLQNFLYIISWLLQIVSFIYLFPIWMISLSLFSSRAMSCKSTLKNLTRKNILVLLLILEGKFFSFLPLLIMLSVGSSYMFFIMLRSFPFVPSFFGCFCHQRGLDFAKCFFPPSIEVQSYDFHLSSDNVVYHVAKFSCIKPSLYSRMHCITSKVHLIDNELQGLKTQKMQMKMSIFFLSWFLFHLLLYFSVPSIRILSQEINKCKNKC